MKHMRKYLGRRWRGARLFGMMVVVMLGYFSAFQPLIHYGWLTPRTSDIRTPCHSEYGGILQRHLLSDKEFEDGGDNISKIDSTIINSTSEKRDPLFPTDLFTKEQLRNGAIGFHILGLVYMFVALAIVCDEFFVPSLDVIIEKLEIQDDVAGATFMAAGGSAPELFTSIIGVFIAFDDVGIGTIVGSAVFNILFVIGMCSLFSRGVLQLTWWPLFRDVTFYSISLLVLILCFLDNNIYWYEALLLLGIYASYVFFMGWNVQVEQLIKKHLYKNKVARETGRVSHTPVIHAGSKFRHGLLHLMISSIDPMHDGVVDEKATQNHAIASLKVLLDATKTPTGNPGTPTDSEYSKPALSPQGPSSHSQAASALESGDSGQYSQETEMSQLGSRNNSNESDEAKENNPKHSRSIRRKSSAELVAHRRVSIDPNTQTNHLNHVPAAADGIVSSASTGEAGQSNNPDGKLEDDDENGALDISWPETRRKQISYILLAPIVFPLWLTLPDPRRQEKKKWFPITFIGSILWIAAFSYLMVWWASVAGNTAGIPNEVMGLTFLAAGTSIPDLITSVIVARKGLGDMAVSSSIGSNIFDVTVGLPVPWFLYGAIHHGAPVQVSSAGMACSIVILFAMLMLVILTIACCRWRMTKSMGIAMFLLYFVFVAVSLLFEYKVWVCPL